MKARFKPWYQSKTLWFNAIVGGLATAEASLHVLQPVTGEKTFAVLALSLAVGNAILRVISTQGITR